MSWTCFFGVRRQERFLNRPMNLNKELVNELRDVYSEKSRDIEQRIAEFTEIHRTGNDKDVFRELSFCMFSSGVGPKMAEKSVEAVDDILLTGSESEMTERLDGIHKFPEKSSYIVTAREYFRNEYDLRIKDVLSSIDDHHKRRDFLVKNIKGLGYLQASHFLRNTGFSGYAILDKNILGFLNKLGVIEDTKTPASKKRYTEKEQKLQEFAHYIDIEFDHLDLLLWYMMRGRIPR